MSKKPQSILVSLVVAAGTALGCSQAAQSTASESSALTADTTDDGGVPATLAPCLTTYVECVRSLASGSDVTACRSSLHACVMPARPEGGDGGACGDHGGGPRGDGGPGAPRDHGPDGDDDDADGGVVPDGDGGAPAGGPRACVDALDTCAAGADTTDVCVADAVTCFAALPRPDRGGGRGRGPGRPH
jgi:hypothetical protein